MNLLCIADTHGQLNEDWYNGEKYDLCIMLGDHTLGDAEKVLKYIPKEKIRALYGNHDVPISGREYISYFGLTKLGYEEVNGVRLLGVGGSLKYKPEGQVGWTQDECSEYMAKQPEADVLITHDLAFGEILKLMPMPEGKRCRAVRVKEFYDISEHPAHIGLRAFNEYLEKYPNCKHIHGHVHKSYEIGNTRSVYMVEMVEV